MNTNLLNNLKKHFHLLSTHEILKLIEENENEIDILAHTEEILPEVILSDSIKCKFNENEYDYDFDDFKFNEALNDFFALAKTSVTSDVKAKIEKDLRFHSNKRCEKMYHPNQYPVLELFLSVETSNFVNIIKKHMGNPVVKLDDFR